jgi:hypothetical protein
MIFLPFEIGGKPVGHFLVSASSDERASLALFAITAWMYGSAVLTAFVFPLAFSGTKSLCRLAALILAAEALWIAWAAVRTPSLFLESLFIPRLGILREAVLAIAGHGGPPTVVVAALITGLVFLFSARLARTRAALIVAYYMLLLASLGIPDGLAPIHLPPGSAVLIFADSWRADFSGAEHAPALSALEAEFHAVHLNGVIPASTRTAVSVASFFTGRPPREHGVLNMFSAPGSFRTELSGPVEWRRNGYCTVAVTEYPGDFLNKDDFGFESVTAPRSDWPAQLAQTLLRRDPFLLAILSHPVLLRLSPQRLANALTGLYSYSDPQSLFAGFARELKRCGSRPVLGFLFLNTTHMPYAQKWPFYLNTDRALFRKYSFGRYSWQHGAVDADFRVYMKSIYSNSVREFDAAAAPFVNNLLSSNAGDPPTVIVTSDHGEYLFDGVDFSGHGDRLEHVRGLTAPWVAFGPRKEEFRSDRSPVSSMELGLLLWWRKSDAAPAVYTESEVWFDAASAPRDRIEYPDTADLFELDPKSGYVTIAGRYVKTVEAAKNRTWFFSNRRYDLKPGKTHTRLERDGEPIALSQFPATLREIAALYLKEAEDARGNSAGSKE